MPAFAVEIEEVSGSRRRIALAGRALPHRGRGFNWEGSMRQSLTWYPGNPVGTLQILGPTELPLTMGGIWKDRFLQNQVEIEGFAFQSATLTAEELCNAFDQIRRSGNLLRVQWGPFVRNGILDRFKAEPLRIEDIQWEASFTWNARDDEQVPRVAPAAESTPELQQAMNEVDDELAYEPPDLLPNYSAQAISAIASVRGRVGSVFDQMRAVQSLLATPAQVLGAVASAVDSIRTEAEDEIGRLIDTPYLYATTSDRVTDVLAAETWRRSVAAAAGRLRAQALRLKRQTAQQVRPGALTVVTVPGDITLRQLALQAYGNADAWQLIADVNGLEGSVVPAGTVVIIPPPPPGAGGVQGARLPA